ncbi:MAG: NifB/NifX family molybdenum-iron cluster-binding protein [Deltaproteobacteria bacterium]|nr:NifB/NifX family molybdenum-iron cluster-binding protein [Deltaproteobacteria bacterium]MBW2112237.1 NifB/NifX family molybdenum-iron cluster-binding protein [Deltaproteobacteria bacterium]
MKIAVSSSGRDLSAQIDPRFGRCAYFVIVETDDMSFEAFDNESIALGGGAGIQAAQFVASKGAAAVITGNCGPNAVQTLGASHVEVFVGQSGTVREAIEKYKRGDMTSTKAANVADHYGMGGGGMGRGMGMGRGGGMGRGMGQGMGRGMGAATLGGSGQSASPAVSREDGLRGLKEQVNDLRRQLEEIESSMSALEKE